MRKVALFGGMALFVLAQSGLAAPVSIGTASAHGSMQIDGRPVYGNATLFEGTLVETGKATTVLRLQKSADLLFGLDSRGKLYSGRVVLEKGSGEIRSAGGCRWEARNLRIAPLDRVSRGIIAYRSPRAVGVEAFTGGFEVRTAGGVLLAKVVPGRAFEFDGEAGASAPITVSGMVTQEHGLFFLTVSQSGVKYEITGQAFRPMLNQNVTITGTPQPNAAPHAGAAAVLLVSKSQLSRNGAAGANGTNGSNGGASGGAGGGAGGGMSGATLGWISGGIAGGTGLGVGIYHATRGAASP